MSRPVVVVTGASAGIGRAAVQRFAARGYDVGLIARGRAGLEGARRDVEAAGGRGLVLPCDVRDPEAVRGAARRAEAELGPVAAWVNAAMVTVLSEVRNLTPQEIHRVTEVVYYGSVHGATAALELFEPRGRGVIVQVGSALAWRGIPLQAPYCGAKHATQGFLESLRAELRHQGSDVKVTLVQLPGVNTPQFGQARVRGIDHHPQPVAPIYQPEVAAKAIVHAAEHPRRELWVGLPTYLTITGNWFAPWLQDRVLARTGYSGQESEQPLEPGRPDYLDGPLDDDRDLGAHGIFDAEAKTSSAALWATLHRGALAGGAAAAALAVTAALRTR
jgi:NAD(P)-dependent dehydrogenase (short-subunit alcohol dehydrogenase family)